MLLQATEMQYDYTNKRVSAVGNVQVYHQGTTIEADQADLRREHASGLRAEGNVRMTEPDGRITYADVMDLSDDFRDGFVDSLRLDTADATRMAAARADRSAGTFTVFHCGVYTACEPCKDDPKKPPTWQVKAARMIHDGNEKMIYFEDARLEFFGKPVAYMPYFSAPDPTVKRKSGFLIPVISSSSIYGFGVDIPYYWALAPDYDLTFTPRLMTKQGVLMRGEWRQRLIDGAYSIRASGIYQLDKDEFLRDDGTAHAGLSRLPRRDRNRRPVRADRPMDLGLGRHPADRPDLLPGLSACSTYQRGTNIAANRPDRRRVAALSHRPRRPQLLRRPHDLLLRLFRSRRAEADSGHPSGARLQLHLRPSRCSAAKLGYRTNLTSLSRGTASFDPDHARRRSTPACAR